MLIGSFGAASQALRPGTVPPERPGVTHGDAEPLQEEDHTPVHHGKVNFGEPPRKFHNGRM